METLTILSYLKKKFNNAYQVKFVSNKIMFTNLLQTNITNDFNDFKFICKKENIEFHTYTVNFEKTTTVVLKGLPVARICENIESQGLKPRAQRYTDPHQIFDMPSHSGHL